MVPTPEGEAPESVVVFDGSSDPQEKRELAAIMRSLATAIENDTYAGRPVLVLEERWLTLHRRTLAQARGAGV
ncbi:MAG: hypothetical protein JW819_02725 [Candidatus Krumholzibacteriota bacterium]|nr:hypothetical protein [Candidatus Krumholzibacteriota bacterium]